jgi:hypothetical protein
MVEEVYHFLDSILQMSIDSQKFGGREATFLHQKKLSPLFIETYEDCRIFSMGR